MRKIAFLSMAAMMVLASCTEELFEENSSLRLDFPAEDTHHIADGDVPSYTLHTDELTVSFDIVSGAGGYTATVQEYEFMPSGHITLAGGLARIEGNTVMVELLDNTADVVVSDRSGAESHVFIYSSHPALQYFTWSKSVAYGCSTKSAIDFGAGAPYQIVAYSDMNAADADMEGSILTTGALLPGLHWYLIADSRGTVRKFDIGVRQGYDIEEEQLTVQANAGDRLTFPFKFGKGWKVVEGETGAERFIYHVSSAHDDFICDTFVVTVDAETASWTFRDREGHQAELTIEITQ